MDILSKYYVYSLINLNNIINPINSNELITSIGIATVSLYFIDKNTDEIVVNMVWTKNIPLNRVSFDKNFDFMFFELL